MGDLLLRRSHSRLVVDSAARSSGHVRLATTALGLLCPGRFAPSTRRTRESGDVPGLEVYVSTGVR